MIDILAPNLSLEFVDRLNEYTQAKARQAWNLPKEVTPKALQRLVGHTRQDALQEAFRMAAKSCGLTVADFSPQRGMPSRYVLDCGHFNLVAIKNQASKSTVGQECKALAMIANERLSGGSEVVDLFTGSRIIEANKPLFAWTAVWKSTPGKGHAQPTWAGFCQLEASGEKHIRSMGLGVAYADLRAAIIEKQAPAAEKEKKPKFMPKVAPSEEVKDTKKD